MKHSVPKLSSIVSTGTRRGFAFATALLLVACSASREHAGSVSVDFPPRATEPIEFSPELGTLRSVLENGMVLNVREDRELPLVTGTLTIRGGSFLDSMHGSKPGAIAAMADQLRSGGTLQLTAEQLDEELHRLAAGISSSAGQESVSVSFSCLSTDVERVFELFRDVLLTPRFDGNRFSLWQSQAIAGISRRKDDPRTVASITFQQLVYGDTPFGRVLTSKDVRRLSRADLQREHQQLLQRASLGRDGGMPQLTSSEGRADAFLTISGAITHEQVEHLVSTYLGLKLRHRSVAAAVAPRTGDPYVPKLSFEPTPGIYFVELPVTQASVFMGQQGPPRLTADYAAIDVFNELFGSGGFGSRLMMRVRTKLGLVYGISGVVMPGPEKGRAIVAFQTKTESVIDAVAASVEELHKLQKFPPERAEVEERHEAIGNSFVFRFDSADEMAQRATALEFLGYPKDYDATYIARIHAVQPTDVLAVANRHWDVSRWVIVIVGNKSLRSELPLLRKVSGLEMMPIRDVSFNEIAAVR